MSIIEYVGSIGGVTGILSIIMFLAYRYLVKQMREDRKFMEDRLTKIIEEYNNTCRGNQEALIKHAQIQTELITWLKARNGGR